MSSAPAFERPAPPALRVDAPSLLRRGQQSIDQLFFAFHLLCERDDTAEGKRALIERLHLEMAVHLQLVEEVVHPALQTGGHTAFEQLMAEARHSHQSAREMLAAIVASPVDETARDARVEALGEFMRRQFAHERELLIPALRQAGLALDELGACLLQQRHALLARYGRALSHGSRPEDESDDPVGRPAGAPGLPTQSHTEPPDDTRIDHEQ
jgi:hypothetical protein